MDLWSTLLPLLLGSAVVPVQATITIVLLETRAGVRNASAWIAGMLAVKLTQGLLFGFVFTAVDHDTESNNVVVSAMILLVGIAFLVLAFRALVRPKTDDTGSLRFASLETWGPGKSLLLGAGAMAACKRP